jgi:hypothetical protein
VGFTTLHPNRQCAASYVLISEPTKTVTHVQ